MKNLTINTMLSSQPPMSSSQTPMSSSQHPMSSSQPPMSSSQRKLGSNAAMRSNFWVAAFVGMTVMLLAFFSAHAQSPVELSSDKPIEIAADALEVLQEKNMAIFTGAVEAVQGNINLKSQRMKVYYHQGNNKSGATANLGAVSRIEVEQDVILSTPEETAKSAKGIYDVDKQIITLVGNVILSRGKNMLRGGRLDYNLKTQKSLLTAGVNASTSNGGAKKSGGRVKGVFVPKQK